MEFSSEALPFAIPLAVVGIAIVIFRVPLMRFSDLLWGLERSPEQRRDLARVAFVPAILLLGWAFMITFIPLPFA